MRPLLLLLCLIFSLAADSAPAELEMPLSPGKNRGQYWIEATVNDTVRMRFLIDTGAVYVLLPQNVYDQLEQAGSIGRQDQLGSKPVTYADGSTAQLPNVRLRSFVVGDRPLDNVRASVAKKGAVPLLGTNVLERLGQWRIDRERNLLIVTPPHREAAAQESEVVAQCRQSLRKVERRHKDIAELRRAHNQETGQLQERANLLKEREDQLNEERRSVDTRVQESVYAYNQKVEALRAEIRQAKQWKAQYERRAQERKRGIEDHKKEIDLEAKGFNGKCTGLLYQEWEGGPWKEFPNLRTSQESAPVAATP